MVLRVRGLRGLGEGSNHGLGFWVTQVWEELCADGPDGEDEEDQTKGHDDDDDAGTGSCHGRGSCSCCQEASAITQV